MSDMNDYRYAATEQRITALIAERDEFRAKLCELAGRHLVVQRESDALRDALRKFGQHMKGCASCNRNPATATCSCGLSLLLPRTIQA